MVIHWKVDRTRLHPVDAHPGDQWDTESFAGYAGTGEFPGGPAGLASELYVPAAHTKTWFHTGAFFGRGRISRHMAHEYYQGDKAAITLADTVLPAGLTGQEEREACRALKGRMLRLARHPRRYFHGVPLFGRVIACPEDNRQWCQVRCPPVSARRLSKERFRLTLLPVVL